MTSAPGLVAALLAVLVAPAPARAPGPVEPGPAQPGPAQPGPVQPGPVQPGPAQPGPAQPGPVQPGPVQPGPVQPGPVQPGPVQPGRTAHATGAPLVAPPGPLPPGRDPGGAVRPDRAAELEAALVRLGDPTLALVARRDAAEALGAPDLGLLLAERRAAALAARAWTDPAADLRAAALEALARVEGPDASAALAALVVDLPEPEATRAATLLSERRAADPELLALVDRALTATPLPAPRLAALLAGLGLAFASSGEPAHHALFPRARLHPAAEVREAAAGALEQALSRLAVQRDDDRADALLAAVEGAAWSPDELALRRATYHVSAGRGLDLALEACARVERRTRGRGDHEGRRLRFLASHVEASALLALGRADEVHAPLLRASMALDGLASERRDLTPIPERPSVVAARRQAEVLEWRAGIELLAATAALAEGAAPTDARVLEHLRATHEFALWAQLREAAVDDKAALSGIDVILDGALGPRRLVLSAPDNARWSGPRRDEALDLMLRLGEGLAVVLGDELPGFVPPTDLPRGAGGAPTFGPADVDPRRATLMRLLRPAQALALQRRLDATWDQQEMRLLDLRLRAVAEQIRRDEEAGWDDLSGLRLPSIYALLVAGDLRADDRADEAVELCARLHADLGSGDAYGQGAWGAWLAARVEIAHGGALGDAGRPAEALDVLGSAVDRLEAVENTIAERKRSERDPRALGIYDRQLDQTRSLRSQALVAMAVNSNVRLGDAERALGYFERAYELNKSEFMRGLLACYRARFGAVDEARALLRTVRPAPEVYYNLACAHALLGDLDEALAMLERELAENHPTPGSQDKQKRWARQDPDLANLWDDPRFVALTAE